MPLYTFLCKDGVWRTRCGHHIAANESPLSPIWMQRDHPGAPVPIRTEFVKDGAKTVAKKMPVFVKEEKKWIGCPVCSITRG